MRVCDGRQPDRWIVLAKSVEPVRAEQRAGHGHAAVELFVFVGDRAGLDQIDDALTDYAGMDAEAAAADEQFHHRFRDTAESYLQRRPFRDERLHETGDIGVDNCDLRRRHLDQWPVRLDRVVDVVRSQRRVARHPGHLRIDLGITTRALSTMVRT